MVGASPNRCRKKCKNNTGGSNFDPTCHEERCWINRQTVMLRHVKPTRPGQHQQHQRRPLFPLTEIWPKTGPFGNGVLSSSRWGIAEKTLQS